MSNLPDDVTDKMIDDQFTEEVKERSEFDYQEGDSHSYSYKTLDMFLNDCKEHGGVTSDEYEGLTLHLKNMATDYENALLQIVQLNSKLRSNKRVA
jgi:hypothetical protein